VLGGNCSTSGTINAKLPNIRLIVPFLDIVLDAFLDAYRQLVNAAWGKAVAYALCKKRDKQSCFSWFTGGASLPTVAPVTSRKEIR
jgi:hypothetical protein